VLELFLAQQEMTLMI